MNEPSRICLAVWLVGASFGCSSESGSPPQRFGAVLVESNTTQEPSQRASGAFFRVKSSSDGSCFVSEELGACRLWRCDDYPATPTLETTGLSAGSVSVAGTKASLEFVERETGSYAWENTLNSALWAGGERLFARVSGSSEFPGISVTLSAPEPVIAKAPIVPAEAWTIASSEDLGFAWSGVSDSDVYVAISVSVPADEGDTSRLYPGLDCAFQGALGTSVIPAGALQKLTRPENSEGYLVELLTFSADTTRVDDAVLEFRATTFALSAPAQIE